MSSKKSKACSMSEGEVLLKKLNAALREFQGMQNAQQKWVERMQSHDAGRAVLKQPDDALLKVTPAVDIEAAETLNKATGAVLASKISPIVAQQGSVKEGSVESAIKDLAVQIDRLGTAVSEMDTRLSMITFPSSGAGAKDTMARPAAVCTLAETLQTFVDRVKNYIDQLQDLRGRIEL